MFPAAAARQQAPGPEERPPAKPPVLIREEVDKAPEPAPVQKDPARAEKEIQIGDFYFKRDNYPAAIGRYREALLYRPDYPTAYEKLIRALERNNEIESARKFMQEYVEKFPSSKKSGDYARLLGASEPRETRRSE